MSRLAATRMSAVQIQIQGSVSVAGRFHLFLSRLTRLTRPSLNSEKDWTTRMVCRAHRDGDVFRDAACGTASRNTGEDEREEQTDLKVATSDLGSATPTKTQ